MQVWRLLENISKSMESKELVGLFALLLVSLLWLSSSKKNGFKVELKYVKMFVIPPITTRCEE